MPGIDFVQDHSRSSAALSVIRFLLLVALFATISSGCDQVEVDPGTVPILQWTKQLPSPSLQPVNPIVSLNSAFVAIGSELQRLDLDSGQVIWKSSLDANNLYGTLSEDIDVIYAYHYDKWIRAYSKEDGQVLWHASIHGSRSGRFSTIIDGKDNLFVPVTDSILSISKTGGNVLSLVTLPDSLTSGTDQIGRYGSVDRDRLCVAYNYPASPLDFPDVERQGLVYYIDVTSGQVEWVYDIPPIEDVGIVFEQLSNSCLLTNELAVVVSSGRMTGLDRASGEPVWDEVFDSPSNSMRDGFAAGPAATDGIDIFVGSAREKVYAVDSDTGEIHWSAQTRGSFGDDLAAINGGRVFITNAAFGELWIIEKSTGRIISSVEPPDELDDDFLSWVSVDGSHLIVTGFKNVYVYRL